MLWGFLTGILGEVIGGYILSKLIDGRQRSGQQVTFIENQVNITQHFRGLPPRQTSDEDKWRAAAFLIIPAVVVAGVAWFYVQYQREIFYWSIGTVFLTTMLGGLLFVLSSSDLSTWKTSFYTFILSIAFHGVLIAIFNPPVTPAGLAETMGILAQITSGEGLLSNLLLVFLENGESIGFLFFRVISLGLLWLAILYNLFLQLRLLWAIQTRNHIQLSAKLIKIQLILAIIATVLPTLYVLYSQWVMSPV